MSTPIISSLALVLMSGVPEELITILSYTIGGFYHIAFHFAKVSLTNFAYRRQAFSTLSGLEVSTSINVNDRAIEILAAFGAAVAVTDEQPGMAFDGRRSVSRDGKRVHIDKA